MRWFTYQEFHAGSGRKNRRSDRSTRGSGRAASSRAAARLRAGNETNADDNCDTTIAARNAAAPARPLLRSAYEAIELYDPGVRRREIDLSDNTNLFGVAPSAERVVRAAPPQTLHALPVRVCAALKRALAELVGVDPANITTGCGSDDVIDSALRAFCEPGDRVALPTPTFGVVATFARMNAAAPLRRRGERRPVAGH